MLEPRDVALNGRIGGRLSILRERRRMSARALGELAGIHRHTIYRIESGDGCTAAVLGRLAFALGVDAYALLCEDVEKFRAITPALVHRRMQYRQMSLRLPTKPT